MKKVLTTATAIVFALGLTAAAQAAPEKAKPAAAPQATATQAQSDKQAAKPEAQKVMAAEAKQGEASTVGKKPEAEPTKKEGMAPAPTGKETGKEAKPAPEKKTNPEAPKTDKK